MTPRKVWCPNCKKFLCEILGGVVHHQAGGVKFIGFCFSIECKCGYVMQIVADRLYTQTVASEMPDATNSNHTDRPAEQKSATRAELSPDELLTV